MSILDSIGSQIHQSHEAVEQWDWERRVAAGEKIEELMAEKLSREINDKILEELFAMQKQLEPEPMHFKNKRMEASFDANSRQSWKYRNRR